MSGTPAAVPERVLPWPLLGLAVLLVVLILLTPGLLDLGRPSASSPTTQAVLVLDRGTGDNATHLYLQGVTTVRYALLDLGVAAVGLRWPILPGTPLTWSNWTNQTDSLVVSTVSTANPIAINVTAEFVDADGAAVFFSGVYAFEVVGPNVDLVSFTPGLDPGVTSLSLSDLPQSLPLLASSSRLG